MSRSLFPFALMLALTLLVPATGRSIPAFARKYGFNCNMCHTAFTRLNDFGQRYRDNGYQIPGQEGTEKNVFDIAPPLSLRTTAGISAYGTAHDSVKGTTAGFNLYGLDLLAAGVFHKDVSFLLIYTPRIDEPAAGQPGPSGGTDPMQVGGLESANLVFSNLVRDALNLRIGRFEPGYHLVSSKRSYYLFEPYEVYAFSTPANSFVFDDNQIGVEAAGHVQGGFKYALGVVNGNGGNPDQNTAKDVYASLSQTFLGGEGQTAGQRIGLFGYLGWQPAAAISGDVVSPTGETNGKDNKTFNRLGVNGSFNYEMFNLSVLFMSGADNAALNLLRPGTDYQFTGGFAQLDFAGMMNNRGVASLMYNWVRPPSYDSGRQIDAYSALIRYYLGDWSAVNVALHAEYTFRRTGADTPIDEHLVSMALDFDF